MPSRPRGRFGILAAPSALQKLNVATKTCPSRVGGDHRKASSRTATAPTPAAPFVERRTAGVDARARLNQKVYTHDG